MNGRELNFYNFTELPIELQAYIGQLSDKVALGRLAYASREQLQIHKYELLSRFMQSNRVVQIDGTGDSTFFVTEQGHVYTCGTNNIGQLGMGDKLPRSFPVRVPSLFNVKKVISRYERTYFLTHSGSVWACGNNFHHELFLQKRKAYKWPSRVPLLSSIVDMQEDDGAFFFLCQDGSVYVCGDNRRGRLGIEGAFYLKKPEVIPGLSNIQRMIIDCDSIYYLDSEGKAFAIGDNDVGQLGLGHKERIVIPKRIPKSLTIENIWSGWKRTYIQTEKDKVYACGLNDEEQLGADANPEQIDPVLIPELRNIKGMFFRDNSTYAITQDGQCYAWGKNNCGQLGLGDKNHRKTPTLIPNLVNVTRVEILGEKTIFFIENDHARVCGRGIKHLPSMDKAVNESLVPIVVPGLSNIKKGKIGRNVYTYLDNNGIVHGWGNNHHYALGLKEADYRDITPITFQHVANYIHNRASVAVLLRYAARGNSVYHNECFEAALKKLVLIDTVSDMLEILPIFYNQRFENNAILQAIFPGYESLGKDKDIIYAYARLLCRYKSFNAILRSELEQQCHFVRMLQDLSEENEQKDYESVRFFKSDSNKTKYYKHLLGELHDVPIASLKAAAGILVDHIPMPDLSNAKRKAEDDLEENTHQGKKSKK